MARAVQLPRPLPTREQEATPARPRVKKPFSEDELVPDRMMKALARELEASMIEREQTPLPDPVGHPVAGPQRARYRYD